MLITELVLDLHLAFHRMVKTVSKFPWHLNVESFQNSIQNKKLNYLSLLLCFYSAPPLCCWAALCYATLSTDISGNGFDIKSAWPGQHAVVCLAYNSLNSLNSLYGYSCPSCLFSCALHVFMFHCLVEYVARNYITFPGKAILRKKQQTTFYLV